MCVWLLDRLWLAFFALLGGHKERYEYCRKQHNGDTESAFKSEIAAAENGAEAFTLRGQYGIGFRISANVKAQKIALRKIPYRVYRTHCPDAAALEHKHSCKNAEKCDIYKGDCGEIGVSYVEYSKRDGAHDDRHPHVVAARDACHEISAEQRLLAHSLKQKCTEEESYHQGIEIRVELKRNTARDITREGGQSDHNKTDKRAYEIFFCTSSLIKAEGKGRSLLERLAVNNRAEYHKSRGCDRCGIHPIRDVIYKIDAVICDRACVQVR